MHNEVIKLEDTIVSIATHPGKSAIGVIKLSGKDSIKIVSSLFKSKKKKNLKKVNSYSLHYGWIIDDRTAIDEVIIAIMRGPCSHTREDVVEIYSHSGNFVLNKILDLCIAGGARLAEGGEFTKRAYINGRIDLVEAEAVNDVINATTEEGLRLGITQLSGALSSKLEKLLDTLRNICIHLEAESNYLLFSDSFSFYF